MTREAPVSGQWSVLCATPTRRHTELFTTAICQLGDDSAALRLAGEHQYELLTPPMA
ncbi:hypothetical protein ACFWWC_17360 [Streptomyces sp. NPDC058642]|uniref:hypothetical protein n=1 Tax=Streptomyces sp. NPDC058642 TaxID=3346572 RepID=UPI00364B7DD8